MQLGKAVTSCEHQDFILYYLPDFICHKFNNVPRECYEVHIALQIDFFIIHNYTKHAVSLFTRLSPTSTGNQKSFDVIENLTELPQFQSFSLLFNAAYVWVFVSSLSCTRINKIKNKKGLTSMKLSLHFMIFENILIGTSNYFYSILIKIKSYLHTLEMAL